MEKNIWNQVRYNDKNGNLPNLRWGHSCCVIEDEVVFFGGYADSNYMNDVWSFNTITMEWKEIQTIGDIPSQRSNCSMNYDKDNNRIIIFGGGGANKKRYNSINILNWANKQWIQINPKSNEPAPWERTYHTAQLFYPYLITFGGEGISDLDDLWVFNFLTLSWTEIPTKNMQIKPCARRFHSSAKIGNQFYVIAGCYSKYRCLSDIYSIDLTSFLKTGDTCELQWRQRKMRENTFLTRWGHTSAVYDDKIYVFGGRFSNDLNDILVIDPSKEQIVSLKVNSEIPKARRRHSACFLGSSMLIFGGFNGEYFNDLHYININYIKKKNHTVTLPNLLNQNKLNQQCGIEFYEVQSSERQKVRISKGLIATSFANSENIDRFIEDIQCELSLKDLKYLLATLSQGFGKIDKQLLYKYDISICDSQQEMINERKNKIVNDNRESLLQNLKRVSKIIDPVISLDEEQCSQYYERQRINNFYDLTINVNKQFLIGANKILLASSQYFANLMSLKYSDGASKYSLNVQTNNLHLFEIMISYLHNRFVVVYKGASTSFWIELLETAYYYAIPELVSICQNQLLNKINDKYCQQLLNLSIHCNLAVLSLACAEYVIKVMVDRQSDYNSIFSEPQSQFVANKKQKLLKMMYSLLRFDILQKKIEKEQKLAETQMKKSESQNHGVNYQEEKQNYQNNV